MSNRIYIGKSRQTPPSRCPYCEKLCDGITGISNDEIPPKWPSPGSVSMCTECAEILMFDERLQLRKLTGPEFADLAMSSIWPVIKISRDALKQIIRKRKGIFN